MLAGLPSSASAQGGSTAADVNDSNNPLTAGPEALHEGDKVTADSQNFSMIRIMAKN